MTPRKTEFSVALDHRPGPKFEHFDYTNAPFNKTRWQIEKSTAHLTVVDCDGPKDEEPWIHVEVCETTQVTERGPFQSRTISSTLKGDDRAALMMMLGARSPQGEALAAIVREQIFGDGTAMCQQRVIDLCLAAEKQFGIKREVQ